MTDQVDVAIVGGGPAGSATAVRLARLGYSVTLFERQPEPRWRACGVFASPLVRDRLASLGMTIQEVAALNRPIAALDLVSARGAHARLDYTKGFACGFDRPRLDAALLDLATRAGTDVRLGTVVRNVTLGSGRNAQSLVVASRLDAETRPSTTAMAARLVVGADGRSSRVARAARASLDRSWFGRSAVTYHVTDPAPADPATGRFLLARGSYVGLAPVPRDRVNAGIVIPTAWLNAGVESAIARAFASFAGSSERLASEARLDSAEVAGRLEHHTSRAGGDGWLLVGDAIEFIDPLTGEGLHRALVTADRAAEAADGWFRGDRHALDDYDRRVRRRFRSKNVVSLVLQAFLAQPVALDYALDRLDRRAALRDELTDVLTDRRSASRAVDPRFLARLLAP